MHARICPEALQSGTACRPGVPGKPIVIVQLGQSHAAQRCDHRLKQGRLLNQRRSDRMPGGAKSAWAVNHSGCLKSTSQIPARLSRKTRTAGSLQSPAARS